MAGVSDVHKWKKSTLFRSDAEVNGNHFLRTGISLDYGTLSQRQIDLWRRFAQTEAPPENGTVDEIDSPDDHRCVSCREYSTQAFLRIMSI